MLILNAIKKCIIVTIAIVSITIFASSSLQAQSNGNSDTVLQQILTVLQKIDTNITMLITNFTTYVIQWVSNDTSTEPLTTLSNYTQTLGNNISLQNGLDSDGKGAAVQTQLLNDLFANVNPKDITNVNDLTYTTLLKLPFRISSTPSETAVDSAYTFIKNASGLNISHFPPVTYKFINKTITDQLIYTNYYNTIMAIESFNAYILSGFYIDYLMNQTPLTQQQLALFTQAKDPAWLTQIASQYIGYVLRQILLYESQTFVILTELLQTTKQMVAAQAMNNTLLILNNQANEKKLFQKAAQIPVTP